MLRLVIPLDHGTDWREYSLTEWSNALHPFMAEAKWEMRLAFTHSGYRVVEFGSVQKTGKRAELIFSSGERAVSLNNFKVEGPWRRTLAEEILHLVKGIGAVGFYTWAEEEQCSFWCNRGAVVLPEAKPFPEVVCREKINVESLFGSCLLVTYAGHPVLCLEPIVCKRPPLGVISLAQYRVEQMLGGLSLGFSSRVSMRSPWKVPGDVWQDLLSYSRLEAYEWIERLIEEEELRQGGVR